MSTTKQPYSLTLHDINISRISFRPQPSQTGTDNASLTNDEREIIQVLLSIRFSFLCINEGLRNITLYDDEYTNYLN